MKAWEQRLVPVGFGLAALFFFVAALKPVFSGRPLNAAFLPSDCCLSSLALLWPESNRFHRPSHRVSNFELSPLDTALPHTMPRFLPSARSSGAQPESDEMTA